MGPLTGNRAILLRSLFWGTMGLVFSVVLGFTGLALAGAGHGTSFFGDVIGAPDAVGFVIWPCIGLLLPWSQRALVRCFVGFLLIINYLGVIRLLLTLPSQQVYVLQTFEALPVVVIFVSASYIAAQAFIIVKMIEKSGTVQR